MKQMAMKVNKNNLVILLACLGDYTIMKAFIENYGYMLDEHETVVVVLDVHHDRSLMVSHVVTLDIFQANAICDRLNFATLEKVIA